MVDDLILGSTEGGREGGREGEREGGREGGKSREEEGFWKMHVLIGRVERGEGQKRRESASDRCVEFHEKPAADR